MSEVTQFLKLLERHGLEYFRVFYGVYRGIVRDIDDPENRGRVQVEIKPFNRSEETMNVWIDPFVPGAGPNRGIYWPAQVGDTCRVMFEAGQPSQPYLALPGWYGEGQRPSEFDDPDGAQKNQKMGMKTRMGHSIVFSDERDNESITIRWTKAADGDPAIEDPSQSADTSASGVQTTLLSFDSDGSLNISIQDGAGISISPENGVSIRQGDNYITMKEDGIQIVDGAGSNFITMKGDAVSIASKKVNINTGTLDVIAGGANIGRGANFSAMLYETWLKWAAAHTHQTGVGPTGPPTPPPTPDIKSQKEKLI